jgi:hypothetical protein
MLSYRELYYQQQDNFQLLQNAMQVQRLEDERMRQLERLYLERSIINEKPELFYDYTIGGATTFSLINTKYRNNHGKVSSINIAGDFSIKHLPWYKDTINKIPRNELYEYVKGAKWSTVIGQCIKPKLKSIDEVYNFEFK